MEKVNYVPRCIRLSQQNLFIKPPKLQPLPSLNESVTSDGTIIVSEFDNFNPKDFSLDAALAAGVVPSEVNYRLHDSKIRSLDSVEELFNALMFNESKLN